MKKSMFGIIAAGAVALIIGLIIVFGAIFYYRIVNKINQMEVDTETAWSKVESAYQRRTDLIDNLVNTVKGYADFEKETLESVVNARSKATSINIDPSNLSPEAIQSFQQNQDALSSSLGRLLLTFERYPDLKANQNFLQLQSQLEGTENRIKVERDRFNDAIGKYNRYIVAVPQKWIADQNGKEKKGFFESDEGAEKAPKVEF